MNNVKKIGLAALLGISVHGCFFPKRQVNSNDNNFKELLVDTPAANCTDNNDSISSDKGCYPLIPYLEYFSKGDYSNALRLSREEIQKNPDKELGYAMIGEIYYTIGEYENAIGSYKQASKNSNPDIQRDYEAKMSRAEDKIKRNQNSLNALSN